MHLKFPEHWQVVSAQCDLALRSVFEGIAESTVKTKIFLKKHKLSLAVFTEQETLDEAIAANGKYIQIPQVVAKLMGCSQTFQAMFQTSWLACSRELFISEVYDHLKTLEHESFAPDHVEQFMQLMESLSHNMRSEGHKRCKQTWPSHLRLGTEDVPMSYTYAGDEYEGIFWARVKTILINTRQHRALPWEDLFWPKGTLTGVPVALMFADAVLEPLEGVRAELFAHFEGKRNMPLAQMIKDVRKLYDDLHYNHRSIEIDMAFLEHKSEALLKQLARIVVPWCL